MSRERVKKMFEVFPEFVGKNKDGDDGIYYVLLDRGVNPLDDTPTMNIKIQFETLKESVIDTIDYIYDTHGDDADFYSYLKEFDRYEQGTPKEVILAERKEASAKVNKILK